MFRLLDIHQNDDDIWVIRMQLCDDDQHDLKILFNHMKKEYGCGENEVSLQCFGDVLCRMGKNDLAEEMYNRLLVKLSPNDHPAFAALCYSFGVISKDRNEYDISLQWFQRSLEIQMRIDPLNYVCIGSLYCCIGNIQME
jgi:tetratricopeptide (TPR) repeat protein